MIKKKMSLLLAAVLVASGVGMVKPAAAAVVVPKITYVEPAITMAEVGDDFSFALQSDYSGKVQYKIWAENTVTGKWYELTNGYTDLVNGKDPFIPSKVNHLPEGSYKASVWVKAEGSTANFDSYAVKNFKIQKDGYFAGRAKMDNLGLKSTYAVGEAVKIVGADQYKLHAWDPTATTNAWAIDTTYETAATTTRSFEKAGTYLVDVWGKKADSKNLYDGWTLQVVTVTASTGLPKATVAEPDITSVPFSTLVQVTLDTKTPENYKVTVKGVELPLETDKAGNKVFIEVLDGTLTKADIEKGLVVVDKTVKEALPKATVAAPDTTSVPFSTLVQVTLDTKTPENYKVTVSGVELPLETDKAGNKVFIEVLDGTLTQAQIEAGLKVVVK